jgi:hypothetical protein
MTQETANDGYGDKEPQILGKDPSNLRLGYLICPLDAANAFLGALMITDSRARPVHFSFVSPVRPTMIQRILFGSTLNSHIKVDVIAQKLLSNIPQIPDVLFVDDMEILSVRQIIKKPTAFLKKNSSSDTDPSRLSSLEFKTGSNMEDQEITGQILAFLENSIDLVEPFLRIRQALKEAIKSQE